MNNNKIKNSSIIHVRLYNSLLEHSNPFYKPISKLVKINIHG